MSTETEYLERKEALALLRQHRMGQEMLRKWREAGIDGLVFRPPGRKRKALYRRRVLLAVMGVGG